MIVTAVLLIALGIAKTSTSVRYYSISVIGTRANVTIPQNMNGAITRIHQEPICVKTVICVKTGCMTALAMPFAKILVSTKFTYFYRLFQVGYWNCTCYEGFSGNGTHCTDIDECAENSHMCNVKNSNCSNTEGSYTCDCFTGYETTRNITCGDIDECLSLDSCPINSTCANTDGSFNCSCVEGTVFTGG